MKRIINFLLIMSCSLFLIGCGSSNDDTDKGQAKKEGIYIERLEDGSGQIVVNTDVQEEYDLDTLFLNFRELTFDEGYKSDIEQIIDTSATKKLQKDVLAIADSQTEEYFALLEDSTRDKALKEFNAAVLNGIESLSNSVTVTDCKLVDDKTIKMSVSGSGLDWNEYKAAVDDYIEKNIDELNPGPVGQEEIVNYSVGTMTRMIGNPKEFGNPVHDFTMNLTFVCANGKWQLDKQSSEKYLDNLIYFEQEA